MTDNEIIRALEEALRVADETINRQKAEVERLRADVVKLHTIIPKMLVEAKIEATKEFAERLKAETISFVEYDEYGWGERVTAVKTSSIDNLAKEMTEKGGE